MAAPHRILILAFVATALLWPTAASAYIGPGSGLSVLGAAFALVAGAVVAVLGFVWYPVKRLWRKLSARGREAPVPERSAQ